VRSRAALLALTVAIARPTHGQTARAAEPGVTLIGANGVRRKLTVADLRTMGSAEVEVSSHNVVGRYRGVPLSALLRRVGAPTGDSLRGKALGQSIVVEGGDGYRVVFAPAELDSGFTEKTVLLAYAKNGAPLDSVEGPLRLIAPGEKRPARWVRGVVTIRVRAEEP
jgi:hypothetical protein